MKILSARRSRLGITRLRTRTRIPRSAWLLAISIIAVAWTLLVGFPLFSLFSRAGSAQFDSSLYGIARATLIQASVSTLISGVIALPMGWLAARAMDASAKLNATFRALLSFPYGVPTVVAGVAWVAVLGKFGWLARLGIHTEILYSFKAVVLAHVFFNAPWVSLFVAERVRSIAPERIEAAKTLGASPMDVFRSVIFPEIRLTWLTMLAQVFAVCSMSFALVLILGGGPPVETLEVSLYSHIRLGELNLNAAAACALVEMALTTLPWIMVLALKAKLGEEKATTPRYQPTSRWGIFFLAIFCLFFIMPYFTIFQGAVFPSWEWMKFPLIISLKISLSAATLSLFLGALGVVACEGAPRFRFFWASLLSLPSGISILVLGLGFWLTYAKWVDPFEGSLLSIIALQATLFLPLVFRSLWSTVGGAQIHALDAAQSLGASPWQAFVAVEWPRLRPILISSFAMVFGASLGEVAAVSLFYSEKIIPLPLLISRAMAQYHFQEAQGVGALLLVITAASFIMASVLSGANHERA